MHAFSHGHIHMCKQFKYLTLANYMCQCCTVYMQYMSILMTLYNTCDIFASNKYRSSLDYIFHYCILMAVYVGKCSWQKTFLYLFFVVWSFLVVKSPNKNFTHKICKHNFWNYNGYFCYQNLKKLNFCCQNFLHLYIYSEWHINSFVT